MKQNKKKKRIREEIQIVQKSREEIVTIRLRRRANGKKPKNNNSILFSCATNSKMLDGAMVDQKIFVYNAARDNNLAALKVSNIHSSLLISQRCQSLCFWNFNCLLLLLNVISEWKRFYLFFILNWILFFLIFVSNILCARL